MKKISMSVLLVILTLLFVHSFPAYAAVDWINIEDKEPVEDYAYSFVVVGDTQTLCYMDASEGTHYMDQIYDWIVANKEEKKIEYVFGLGDITDRDFDAKENGEWKVAQKAIRKLDGVVPYSMVRGNHDNLGRFHNVFKDEFYLSQFEGFYVDGIASDTYRTLSVCGDDYLLITLDHGPTDRQLEWASGIISKYPDHRVIISTHWYLAKDGQPGDVKDYGSSKPIIENHGTEIWDKLIKKHANIFMVMSGHYSTADIVVSQKTNPAGNKVIQMLVDPQGYDASDPSGMIGILYFSKDGKKIHVEYFSPIKNQYFREKNQFAVRIAKGFINSYDNTSAVSEATTAAPMITSDIASAEATKDVTSATQSSSGCRAVLSTGAVFALCVPFAMSALLLKRKTKE